MIYIDSVGHLMTDGSLEELHVFAQHLGLRREWFQDKRYKHYDLTTERMRLKAIRYGAVLVSSKELVRIAKRRVKE